MKDPILHPAAKANERAKQVLEHPFVIRQIADIINTAVENGNFSTSVGEYKMERANVIQAHLEKFGYVCSQEVMWGDNITLTVSWGEG